MRARGQTTGVWTGKPDTQTSLDTREEMYDNPLGPQDRDPDGSRSGPFGGYIPLNRNYRDQRSWGLRDGKGRQTESGYVEG